MQLQMEKQERYILQQISDHYPSFKLRMLGEE
jgi:hypothetical protein